MPRLLVSAIGTVLLLLLALPLIVTPDAVFPHVVGKAVYARSLIEILAALWGVLLLFDPAYRPRGSKIILAFGAYVLVAALAMAWGVSKTHSFWSDYLRMGGVWDTLHWFVFIVVLASVVRSDAGWDRVFNVNLAVVAVVLVLAVFQSFGIVLLPLFYSECRVGATLGNASYLAAILVVTVPLAAGLLARSFMSPPVLDRVRRQSRANKRRPQQTAFKWSVFGLRVLWIASIVLGAWVLLETGTRAALVGLVAGAMVMLVGLLARNGRPAVLPAMASAGGVLGLTVVFFAVHLWVPLPVGANCRQEAAPARAVSTTVGDASVVSRMTAVRVGFDAFRARPLLGWGPENFSTAFERFADPSIYRYWTEPMDRAHNQPIEELATKGILGLLTFSALWAALAWVGIRKKATPRDQVLAVAVLGALAGYFVQNLFLFDTPAAMLQWCILVAWLAREERRPVGNADTSEPQRVGRDRTPSFLGSTWVRVSAIAAVALLLPLSLFFLNYRPLAAARIYFSSAGAGATVAEQLDVAQESIATFPPLANDLRLSLFDSLADAWPNLSFLDKPAARSLVRREAGEALRLEPENPQVLAGVVKILQAMASNQADLLAVEPFLRRLRENAPNRVETHQRLATQALLKRDYHEALRIIEEFVAIAPRTAPLFEDIEREARAGLGASPP